MPRPRLEASPWWDDLLELKDSHTLHELAERFGVSVNGLSRALKRAGIRRSTVRTGAGGGRSEPDPRSAEAQSWWAEFLVLKDKHSLAELAERFGVAEITLQRALKRTGVNRQSQRGARGNRQTQASNRKIERVAHLLGVVPDGEVARQAGVSRYAVAQYRQANGISSVRDGARGTGKASGAGGLLPLSPAASLTLRRITQGKEAYLVRVSAAVEEQGTPLRFVAVGSDLADAAARAQAAVARRMSESGGEWNIDGLEFLGPAL